MAKASFWLLGLGSLLLTGLPARGAEPPAPDRDVLGLAGRIDQLIAAKIEASACTPAPAANDAEFLRRAYLDLAGRIPSVTEARDFLADRSPDKRRRLVDRLLESSRYVTHFSSVWRSLLVPEANASIQGFRFGPAMETWLRAELAKNAPYDEMVRELLTSPVGPEQQRGVFGGGSNPSPAAFYFAKEFKAEDLAAATSRLFLGVRLECAQCHNHPFARWKREQFWSYAAFFAGLQAQGRGQPGREFTDRRELAIPGTEKVAQAKFLDGSEPTWKPKASARVTLADWMTAADNPFFARAAVNRLWGYFFGIGLIDPVDDMVGSERIASHPELLDLLAKEFAGHKFDLKFLIRAIVASQAYQRSSVRTHDSQDDATLFARMAIKGLTAEQLFDSVSQATGYQEARNDFGPFIIGPGTPRTEFVGKFSQQNEKITEVQTSILQALALMNGKLIGDATNLERSETLAAVADAPFLDGRGRIEALYLASLSRPPTPKELERLVNYVEVHTTGSTDSEREKSARLALADVFWALLNSGEFFLNH
jgi:hypothetical protein